MRLYEFSSGDSSQGCARRLLGLWTLNYPEYPTTSNALMKRLRLIKSRPETAQPPTSGSQASPECEESSLPNSPAPRGTGVEGPAITPPREGIAGDPTGIPVTPQGEPEEESMDSDPDLEELVQKVDQHYRRLLRETNLKGRRSTKWNGVRVDSKQRAAINKWMRGVKPKTP